MTGNNNGQKKILTIYSNPYEYAFVIFVYVYYNESGSGQISNYFLIFLEFYVSVKLFCYFKLRDNTCKKVFKSLL